MKRTNDLIATLLTLMLGGGTATLAQDVDWRLLNADVATLGGGQLELRIVMHLDGADLPEASQFSVPVSILFNGLPIEPDHVVTITALTPATPCANPPNGDGTCTQAAVPCQQLMYDYKGSPGTVDGKCLQNFQVGQCQCLTGLPPVFHKIIPEPVEPSGTFEIIIDPFNQQPETDESNNSFSFDWAGAWECLPSEGWEVYGLGSLGGSGGWKGWDSDPAFDAPVTDVQARDGIQSVQIGGDADLVHEFCVSPGIWSYSAWTYVPSDFTSGGAGTTAGSWFILLNTYNDGGPYNWSVQVQIDSNNGLIKVYDGVLDQDPNGFDVPIETDRWVNIQTIVDLEDDWTRIYYDDDLIAEYSWTGGVLGNGGGGLDLAAVDLFAQGSTSVYYDDLVLEPLTGCGEGLFSDADGDGLDLGEEFVLGTDSCLADTDEDGVIDGDDNCPTDPNDQADTDGDGIGNACEDCPGDIDGDASIGIAEFLAVLGLWGEVEPGHPLDLDGDGIIGIVEFLFVLGTWGDC